MQRKVVCWLMTCRFFAQRLMHSHVVPASKVPTGLLCYSIKDLFKEGITGEQRLAKGWIKSVRKQKKLTFFTLTDGGVLDLQIVNACESNEHVKVGSAVQALGTLKNSEGKSQKYDFILDDWKYVSNPIFTETESPYSKAFQRQLNLSRHRMYWRPRVDTLAALMRIRSATKQFMHEFFKERDFIQIDTPILTSSDCEGAGESFYLKPSNKSLYAKHDQIDDDTNDLNDTQSPDEVYKKEFFGIPTFLTVSSQMHLEVCANSLNRVYSFNPAFRAESSLTKQHLAEFYMLEVEVAFLDELSELMQLVEKLIKSTAEKLLGDHAIDLNRCLQAEAKNRLSELERWLKLNAFPALSYTEAVNILGRACNEGLVTRNIKHGDDLCKEHERYLVKYCGRLPVFVTSYPAHLKPFYMKRGEMEGQEMAQCFDLLAPDCGEVCGGSLREPSFEKLTERLQRTNFHDNLRWYAESRRHGYAPTGGFGLGFERYLQFLFGFENVKDCIPFPRWYKHCQL